MNLLKLVLLPFPAVPDKVLVSPPTNVYKGPLISPVATTFMDDLGKGVISPEEALQLMNNYVSGSQDMTQSIKQLGSMLPHQSFPGGDPRIDTRGTARGQASPSFSAPPQFSAPPSFAAPPSFSAPPSLSASPSNSEIASILAHGPQNLPDMQSMSSMSGPQLNLIDHPEGEPYPMHGDQGASHGPGFGPMMGPESGPGHGFGPDEEQNRFLAERNFEPEHHFGPDEHYEPERPREFEHSPHMDNDLPAVNQMSPDGKPDPIHVYQKGDLLDEFREHPNRHLTLPGLEGEHRIGERPSSMFADEGPRFSPEMNSFHSPRIQTGIARQMDPANMFRQAPPPPNQFEPIPSHQDVEKFINNMDPHERSSNPNLATPEVDFPRQTANIEMPERSVGTSDFASHNMGPSTFPETSMGSSYAGLSPMANEPLQSPSVTSPEANIPQSIAMEYASIRSGQPYVGARIPSRQPFAEPHPQQESLPQFHQPQIRQQIQPEAPSNVPVMNHPHISDAYTDSLFPEDLADIESLKGSLQGKTLSMYDSEGEAQQQRGQSRSNLNHGNPQAPSGGGVCCISHFNEPLPVDST